jgi:dephospho-CoA kinase
LSRKAAPLRIALYGKSGAGKTSIAEYLVSHYGFIRLSTGVACRNVCRLLFGSESKTIMNRVTDALKGIDEHVWLKAALETHKSAGTGIVFDSMRFVSDYEYLRMHEYSVWKVTAPKPLRLNRLAERGQLYDPDVDESYRGETELEELSYDGVFKNDGDLQVLHSQIRRELFEVLSEAIEPSREAR